MAALFPDLEPWRGSQLGRESIQTTGGVLMGRNSFAAAEDPDLYAENYAYQAPIFVLTHRPPARSSKRGLPTGAPVLSDRQRGIINQGALPAHPKREIAILFSGPDMLEEVELPW